MELVDPNRCPRHGDVAAVVWGIEQAVQPGINSAAAPDYGSLAKVLKLPGASETETLLRSIRQRLRPYFSCYPASRRTAPSVHVACRVTVEASSPFSLSRLMQPVRADVQKQHPLTSRHKGIPGHGPGLPVSASSFRHPNLSCSIASRTVPQGENLREDAIYRGCGTPVGLWVQDARLSTTLEEL